MLVARQGQRGALEARVGRARASFLWGQRAHRFREPANIAPAALGAPDVIELPPCGQPEDARYAPQFRVVTGCAEFFEVSETLLSILLPAHGSPPLLVHP